MSIPLPAPSAVRVEHVIDGIGREVRAHVVSIRRESDRALVAEFEGARPAAEWLQERAYRYVPGTNGCWAKEAA